MEADCEIQRRPSETEQSLSHVELEQQPTSLTSCQQEETVSLVSCEQEEEPVSLTTCGSSFVSECEEEERESVTSCESGDRECEVADLEAAERGEDGGAGGDGRKDEELEGAVGGEEWPAGEREACTAETPGLESLRSESGICSSLESNYQELQEPGGSSLRTELERLRREKETEVQRIRRELNKQKQQDIRRAINAKNEQISELRRKLQLDRDRAVSAALLGHRQATAPSHQLEIEKLKEYIRELEAERDELRAQAQLCRIREKQRVAELRRQKQQQDRDVKRLVDESRRESVRESKDLARLQTVINEKDKEIAARERQIYKLECQKCYLGEEIYRLTGVEEGFWSDQTLQKSGVSERERGLLRRTSQLGLQISQLQIQCKNLRTANDGLRNAMDSELERPLSLRAQAAEQKREAQILRKKNQELSSMTRKLEEKVKTLEELQKVKEAPPEERRERTRPRIVRRLPQTRAVPVETEQQLQRRASQKSVTAPQRTVSAQQRTSSAQPRSASVQQRTASAQQRPAASAPQQQRALSAPPRNGERTVSRERSGLQQRTTLTAKQRERESEYHRQIKERDSEIKRLKERMKVISDKLSKKNELQILKEKGKKELVSIIQQLQKEKTRLEEQLQALSETLRHQRESDSEKFSSLEQENNTLLKQLQEVNKLVQDHQEIQTQFEEKIEECEQLAESLQSKNELCDDLEKQLTKVIEKNTELTIQNSDLQRQVHDLDSINSQCASLKENLSYVETEYESAKFEVESLRGKVSTLESVLKQMRDAAERKKELERQHQEAQEQLRQKQEEIQKLSQSSETERQASLDTIKTLESKIRELEKKAEVQSLRHEELMLEMSSLKKQSKYKSSLDGSPEGTITPADSMLLSNESTARSTPVGTAITPASLEALTEVDETPAWGQQRRSDINLPSSSGGVARTVATSAELDKIMAKIANDNRVLAELDKTRSTIGLSNSLANSGSASTHPTFLTSTMAPLSAPYGHLVSGPGTSSAAVAVAAAAVPGAYTSATYPAAVVTSLPAQILVHPQQPPAPAAVPGVPGVPALHPGPAPPGYPTLEQAGLTVLPVSAGGPAQLSAQLAGLYRHLPDDKVGMINGAIPGMLPAGLAQLAAHQSNIVDVLDIPGKGRCQVFIARYSYDPFQHSPNEAPESELALNAGDYVLVWGHMDEDGFLDGELLDGRRGLVPSNFVQKLVGEDLLEFHRQVVAGLRDCDQTSIATTLPHDLDFNSSDEAFVNLDEYSPPAPLAAYSYDSLAYSDEEEDAHLVNSANHGTDLFFSVLVPAPCQLTLERQLNKSIVIGWTAPEAPPGSIDCYHVYVDGLLKATVRATDRTRALIEGVDSTRPHRISVRSVTPNRRTSRDAACTMLIGKEVPIAPTAVRATNVTSTSAVISWMPSNSNYQHTVCVNNVEVRTVKPGVYRHTITGISPNTTYRVSVKVKNITAPQFANRSSKYQERLATHIEFRTLPKGVPDPPVDVQCELGPQEGTVLVTWLPVTINSTSGTSNGAPVTGYAVYADGKKVTELDSPTGDHALIDLHNIHGFNPKQVTVRTKSRDSVSADSVPCPIPQRSQRKFSEYDADELSDIPEEAEYELSDPELPPDVSRMRPQQHHETNSAHSSPRAPRRRVPPVGGHQLGPNSQQVLDTEENLSDKEIYPGGYMPIPQIEITKDSASEGQGSVEYSEEDYEPRGPRGRVRGNLDRGRPLPHHDPNRDPRNRHRPDDYNCSGYRPGPGQQQVNSGPSMSQQHQQHHQHHQQQQQQQPVRRNGAAAGREERMRIFVALFDYDPPTMSPNPDACDEELPFREGQLIKIYGEKDADGFYWGEASGRTGYVPCNMVSEVQVDDERLAQELLREEERPAGRSRGNTAGGGGRSRAQEDRWGDIYANMPMKRMVALYDYDPQELSPNVDAEVELSFSTGDIIHVYGEMDDDGFYIGEINGVRGLVPSNFLTEAPQNYERRRGHDLPPPERRGPPGPGVHGPPLPPRDKGDPRDRRKDVRPAEERGSGRSGADTGRPAAERDPNPRRHGQRW